MVTLSSPQGVCSFVVLFICSCAYLRRVPRLTALVDQNRSGPLGIFYKAAIVGQRLPTIMAAACLILAVRLLVV
jgi:hypothetical protein